MIYLLALIAVFLVLAALYESWAIPFSVGMVAPLGMLGVAVGALIRSYSNDVYFTVGMVTVMGFEREKRHSDY